MGPVRLAQPLAHLAIEVDEVFVGEAVLERQHRDRVPRLGELRGRRAGHALRGGIGVTSSGCAASSSRSSFISRSYSASGTAGSLRT